MIKADMFNKLSTGASAYLVSPAVAATAWNQNFVKQKPIDSKGNAFIPKGEDEKWWVYIRNKDKSLLASKIVVDVLKRQSSNLGTMISYGKNEEALLKYLEENERINLQEFRKMVNISKWRAAKILVNLISAGVIRNHTHEKTEFYTLA